MRALAPLLALALVLVAASALYWVDKLRQPPEQPATQAEAPRTPDSYFTGFRLRAFEHPGEATYVLRGQRLTHYADDDTADIRSPVLDYDAADTAPWHVTARRGHLEPAGERVTLTGDVQLERRAPAIQVPPDTAPMTLTTSRLTVFTQAGRAETERPAVAQGPNWRMAATGMTAWFDAARVALHNNVDGRYAPPARTN
jgi:LPS export ABC transporter protein LptC